jgi:hypothetical protein
MSLQVVESSSEWPLDFMIRHPLARPSVWTVKATVTVPPARALDAARG